MPGKSSESHLTEKEHFYINRKARDRFHLTSPEVLILPAEARTALRQAEQQTEEINRRIELIGDTKTKKLLPAQFHGMKLLHAVFHHILSKASGLSGTALAFVEKETSHWHTREYLANFLAVFPPQELYQTQHRPDEFLNSSRNLQEAVEESYLVWLNNQNPALKQFEDLISDSELKKSQIYPHVVHAMQQAMHSAGPVGAEQLYLDELLTIPMRHAPDSLLAQLRFIRLHWSDILEDAPWWNLIDEVITLIEDEDRYLFFEKLASDHAHPDSSTAEEQQETHAPSFSSLVDAPARYSHDSSWMPEVVMLAKSTYVWLDQLSRYYGFPVRRLQDIPDHELDLMAERGFTALWLIGLWERSHASQQIKQLQGNPEAKASAYALEKYEIALEIGGYEGYLDLRNRAIQRGIRLASDMVPNHTGIDSELVRQKPEWFLSTTEPPYPNYSYQGPNLSGDSRYGIHIEDGYWNRSDAAVTFKRVDYLTGDTRYIYHGNDGTIMPWNDTAQLNFLDPEVREGVIQEILHVARMFPVIRFDAAMVLAKMHIQRLWFPLPGHAPGVPSRGSSAMSMSDFEAAIPQEFWREVVDRIGREVPGTLLLAEAFWMLEGYFVRTLGMHRVYNSAFMHMLKKEDNAGYRNLIKKTLEFDAGILKRYVNFMNNPDEDTAIAQFGKGDKYFGVCLMMITMPGLPMIGHGQVEGLTEKYGMEYGRAYYDEQPDLELLSRHYREIFPVLKKRRLFAEVSHFYLFDLYAPEGVVNEHVYAYTNRLGDERALVLYNNRYDAAEGWIRLSVGYLDNGEIKQTLLADALLLPHEHDAYLVLKEHATGLEFIRSCRSIRENGLFITLQGYRYNLFLDFRIVKPSRLKPYDRVCDHLNGRGAESIELEALSMSLKPVHEIISSELLLLGMVASPEELPGGTELPVEADVSGEKKVSGKAEDSGKEAVSGEQEATGFGLQCASMLDKLSIKFEEIMESPLTVPEGASDVAAARCLNALKLEETLERFGGEKRLKAALGIGETGSSGYRRMSRQLIAIESIQEMLDHNGLLKHQLIDEWMLGNTLAALWSNELPLSNDGTGMVDLISCILVLKPTPEMVTKPEAYLKASIRTLFETGDRHFEAFMQFQHLQEKVWFREHRLTIMLSWITMHAILHEPAVIETDDLVVPEKSTSANWLEALEKLDTAAFLSGYEMHALLREI